MKLGVNNYYNDDEEPDFFTDRDVGRPSERLQGGK